MSYKQKLLLWSIPATLVTIAIILGYVGIYANYLDNEKAAQFFAGTAFMTFCLGLISFPVIDIIINP